MKPAISEPVGVKQTISSHFFFLFLGWEVQKTLNNSACGKPWFFLSLGPVIQFLLFSDHSAVKREQLNIKNRPASLLMIARLYTSNATGIKVQLFT